MSENRRTICRAWAQTLYDHASDADRSMLFEAISARAAYCVAAALYLVAGATVALTEIEFALFGFLPVGALFAWRAAAAHRRIDAWIARSLAAHLIEHGTTELAEAA